MSATPSQPLNLGQSFYVKESNCPHCRVSLGGAINVGGLNLQDPAKRPAPGAFTICAHCGHWAVYMDDLALRAATPEEVQDIEKESPITAQMAQKFRDRARKRS